MITLLVAILTGDLSWILYGFLFESLAFFALLAFVAATHIEERIRDRRVLESDRVHR